MESWERFPGEYQEKATEVGKRQNRAGSGSGQAKKKKKVRDPSGVGGADGGDLFC